MVPKIKIKGLNSVKKKLELELKKRKAETAQGIQVGYSAPYAIYVHEAVEMRLWGKPRKSGIGVYWDPLGEAQAKFLETPARTKRKQLEAHMQTVAKNTNSVRRGMKAFGDLLLKESKKLVPVETGALRDSGYVRWE